MEEGKGERERENKWNGKEGKGRGIWQGKQKLEKMHLNMGKTVTLCKILKDKMIDLVNDIIHLKWHPNPHYY